MLRIITTFLIIAFINTYSQAQNESPKELINSMIKTVNAHKSLKFTLITRERIEKKIVEQKGSFKLQISPKKKIYCKMEYPTTAEVLWSEGQNSGMALVNPNTFPYVNLNLDPAGSIMRENQQHTILETGFAYTISIIEHLLKKFDTQFDNMVELKELQTFDNHSCYVIEFYNPKFSFINYKVKKNETISSIAKNKFLSDYMILELNESADDYNDISEGQEIKIPSEYAKKMTLYLDKNRLIPLCIKLYDDKGLFAEYKYYDVSVDCKFSEKDFSETNSEYGF